ncbi:MAG: hypothetical protein JNL01_05210 [Bdellovibrionales bacterium]|nr:hypothetical protein [Bdellovibrionales bacterium]
MLLDRVSNQLSASLRSRPLLSAVGHLLAYTVVSVCFYLLVLTLITYFLAFSRSRFQDITDVFGANALPLVSLGSVLFLVLLRALNPITATTTDEIFTLFRLRKRFLPGFGIGAALGLGIVAAVLVSGSYRYLGVLVQMDEALLSMTSIGFRVLTLVVLVYCEEFIFRYKVLNGLRAVMSDPMAVVLSTLAFCWVKSLQFDLGIAQLATLFLIGIAVSVRTITEADFSKGAGYWAGILVILHPVFSLPILGNDYQGIFLIRYQNPELTTASTSQLSRFLTGGAGGPLSSIAIQLVLVVDILQGILKNKKTLLTNRNRGIK